MKKVSKIFFILVVMFLLPLFLLGCTGDSKDINKKLIFTTVIVDKKDGEIYFYVEVANIEGGGSNNNNSSAGSKYFYVKSQGKTIAEARSDLDRQLNMEPYVSAIRTVVLTENFAKEDLVEYVYRLRSDELYRKKAIAVITKEDPEQLLKACNEKDASVGFYTDNMLKTLEESGESFSRTTTRLIENLSDKYTGFLMPCIGLHDKDIALVGYSVVNGSTITGFIPVQGAKGTIYLKTDKPKFNYVIPYKDNRFTIQVSLKSRKIKPTYENGKITFNMNLSFDAILMYGDKKTPYNFTDTDNAEVTRILTQMLKSEITNAVDQAQNNYKCDYLQFDDIFRINYPAVFETMDWQSEFSKASFNTTVNVILHDEWMMDYETNVQK